MPTIGRMVGKPWMIAAITLLLASCGTSGSGGSAESASSSTVRSAATTTTPPAAPVAAPSVIPSPITFAEEKYGITIDAQDIGPTIVDGVDHQRGIFDKSNWRVVAQCDQMLGTTLKAGAIKNDEFAVITAAKQGASIADNAFKNLLTCP